MPYGLEIRNASGQLTFSSDTAYGGVCLGFFVVPVGGVLTFPDFATATGKAINPNGATGGIVSGGYSTDANLGYLRFTFSVGFVGFTVALFAI